MNTNLHITIVTFAWPPRNSIGAHRPYSWAKYWSEAGAKVRVLTAKKYAFDEPLDLDLPALPGVEVIETDYGNGRVNWAARIAASRFGGLARQIYKKLRSSGSAVKNPRENWLGAVLQNAEQLAHETDVVISTYDPKAVHEIASTMKQVNPKLVWVADYRDLWSLNHAPQWSSQERAEVTNTEQHVVAPWADSVCSVSEPLARQQGEFLNKNWLTVTNGFDVPTEDIAAALRKSNRKSQGALKIVYTGKLYRGLRDPSVLLQTIERMENEGTIERSSVELHIYGGQLDGLAEMMPKGRYDHFVTLHGHVKRETALAAQRNCDLLLLLESPLPEAAGVLTGKIFEYIASAVPILSLGSTKQSAIGQVLASTKAGLCAEASQEDVAATLRTILAGETPSWFAPDLQEIASYSRQAQAEKLLHHIEACHHAKVSSGG